MLNFRLQLKLRCLRSLETEKKAERSLLPSIAKIKRTENVKQICKF